MGDIWPYGPPNYLSWDTVHNYFTGLTGNSDFAAIMAAIGTAESSLDTRVINDTAATGDYSVGIWQINYYGNLRSDRTAAFGTPKQLIEGGLDKQAHAALSIANGQGLTAWSTYNNGAYKRYLHGAPSQPGQTQRGYTPIPPPTNPGKDSWSKQITDSAKTTNYYAVRMHAYSEALIRLHRKV